MADIVETATSAGSFKTFLQAAHTAGLVETLKGRGPYTVFAPNDDAFAKLPSATLQSLLNDKVQLAKVLTYHVVPGKLTVKEVAKTNTAKTVQGQSLSFNNSNGVHVNEARIVTPDIQADNGVIHAVDSVILPK